MERLHKVQALNVNNQMKNIDTNLILESLNKGETYTIENVSGKMLGYVRCWANRKGFFVTKIDGKAVVMKERENKIRTELFSKLQSGDKFFIQVEPNQTQYLRTLVSQYNRGATIKYRVQKVENSKPGEFLLYPNPLHGMEPPQAESSNNQNPFLL